MKRVDLQHGDVILERVAEIPSDAKRVKVTGNRFTIEKGEGVNLHELVSIGELCDKIEVFEKDGIMFVKAKKDVELTHTEHGTKILKKGTYRKNIERVYDYEQQEERRVID